MIHTRSFKTSHQLIISILLVLLVSVACFLSTGLLGYKVVALLLLMSVSILAMLFDILPVLISAALSALIWNFFFIPPVFTFHIDNTEDLLMFMLYFVIASVNAVLTFKIRKEESRARDKEEKEKTIKLYNTLLNSLSHELRTPVSTIIGAVDTLKENKNKLSQNHQEELLDQMESASLRLNRQVENLLNMSRLETGMLKPHFDWCDINELIYDVIQKIDDEHRTRIDFTADETMPLFKLDRGLMEQVLQNLVHNAIAYTPEQTPIQLSASYQRNCLILMIADSGHGIAEQEKPFVFDKFYRVPNSKTGGSGLGLSIVKGFVEAHHGQVRVEQNVFGGATFIIEIPSEVSFLNNLKNE